MQAWLPPDDAERILRVSLIDMLRIGSPETTATALAIQSWLDARDDGDEDGRLPPSLEHALGLSGRTSERRSARDLALTTLAGVHYRGLPVVQQAASIASDLANYLATAWKRDREAAARDPTDKPDGKRGLLFDIARLNDGESLSREWLRKVLSGRARAGNDHPASS